MYICRMAIYMLPGDGGGGKQHKSRVRGGSRRDNFSSCNGVQRLDPPFKEGSALLAPSC